MRISTQRKPQTENPQRVSHRISVQAITDRKLAPAPALIFQRINRGSIHLEAGFEEHDLGCRNAVDKGSMVLLWIS
ncbi:hypothetical protein AMELA_G00005070 [Ameiurus melas]|uniref:Uncharacterized protein n=1 Tax=Ameiurus melas TaxID=219545 RepID=A0A7J6BF20_AMEME|nr:hypothetical protein AMELA_G00005070 [Ameiurus melas]